MLKLFERLFFSIGVILIIGNFSKITGFVISNFFVPPNFKFNLVGFLFLLFSILLFTTRKSLEAILVPTGDLVADVERTDSAVKDYKSHQDEYVMVTGIIHRDERGKIKLPSQSISIYKRLRKGGVPRENIIFESNSKNTLQNFVYSLRELKRIGIENIKISTDDWQYKRFVFYLKRAKKEGLVGEDFKMELVLSGNPRPNLPYAVLAYYQDVGKINSFGSVEKAAESGKSFGLRNWYYRARGVLGI